jgi:cytidine deaminase
MEKLSNRELIKKAQEAREMSYCPYSHFAVGAALLTKSGKLYLGANIENASFTPTVCAERVAFERAVFDGELEFSKIAIVAARLGDIPSEPCAPCGVCRQVMAEFCDGDFQIVLADDKVYTLSELLPLRFDKNNL